MAEKFHVSLESLVRENPGLDPNAMEIGHTLRIPPSAASLAGQATATPEPLPIDQVACHPIADGGLWCFVLLRNDTDNIIENVTAQLTLVDPQGESVASAQATLLLDILPPGDSLPLAVFFPPGEDAASVPQVQILTAMRLLPTDSRYLQASLHNMLAQVSWSGLTAQLRGEVLLPVDSPDAKSVWVAAVAYDETGSVVGIRRWESTAGLKAGGSMPFSFMISAVAGYIARVDYVVEARP